MVKNKKVEFNSKEFMDSLPTYSQMERVRKFESCGLTISKCKDGVLIEYTKTNKDRYSAMVFNPTHYEKELEKAKYEVIKKNGGNYGW